MPLLSPQQYMLPLRVHWANTDFGEKVIIVMIAAEILLGLLGLFLTFNEGHAQDLVLKGILSAQKQVDADLGVLNGSVVRQMGEQQDAFNKMNKVLTNSLTVSERAAATANRSSEESLRAYLAITVTSDVLDPNKKASVTLQALNTGHTPAINMSLRVLMVVAKNIEMAHQIAVKAKLYDSSARFLGQTGSKAVAFSGMPVTATAESTDPLSEEAYSLILNQSLSEYAFGYAEYTDAFGKLRRTSACFFYLPSQKKFANCEKYNSISLSSK